MEVNFSDSGNSSFMTQSLMMQCSDSDTDANKKQKQTSLKPTVDSLEVFWTTQEFDEEIKNGMRTKY